MLRRTVIAIVWAMTVAAILTYAITLSSSYQACIAKQPETNAKPEEQNFHDRVSALINCEVETLNANTGAITALATLAIGVFTFTLYSVTGDTLRLARDEFNASHRPRITVRSIRFREDGIGQTDHSSVDIIIVNTGESAAEIMAIGSAIGTREPRGRPPPRIDAAPDIVPSGIMVLKTGERRRINITRTPPPDPLEFIDIANRNIELAVAGEIRYRAISGGIERLTGFYRIYDPPSERFVASKNAEDEYQD